MSEFQVEWIAKYIPRAPRVIFDVGTYDGADAVRFKQAYPSARVFAFEACPDNFARMEAAGMTAKADVEIRHAAAGEIDGEIDFLSNADARHKRDDDGCSGSILKATPENFEKYPFLRFKAPKKVPSQRLDTFCAKEGILAIDVLHLDVQGAEGFVLKGLGKLCPGMIFLEIDATKEYEGAMPLESLRQTLAGMGYRKQWEGAHDALYVFASLLRDPVDDLTVAITNFKRPKFLDRALASVRAAGIRRVAIAAVCPDADVERVIAKHAAGWISYDVSRVRDDIGCNATWMVAAYRSRTRRLILLHDDDVLLPGLAKTYREVIAPVLDRGEAGFASWRAGILYPDGRVTPCEYFTGPTRVVPSGELKAVIAPRLTHSPVISVFDREVLIHAVKEAEQTLTANESLQRPGMLLGTELLVYLRHCSAFPRWLYVDERLSNYGWHEGSGTVTEQRHGRVDALKAGYALARGQAERPAPPPEPRLILMHFASYAGRDASERARFAKVWPSWEFHFGTTAAIELPVRVDDLERDSREVGDLDFIVPYARDLFDFGCRHAMPEDVVVYANRDIGFTTLAPEMILAGVSRGRGVTACQRRSLVPAPGRLYRTVRNCRDDGGFDVMAVSPAWWMARGRDLPDMLIGREAWDACFRMLAEDWADDLPPHGHLATKTAQYAASKAYTDDVCWHEPHTPYWETVRTSSASQRHNRKLARAFFLARGEVRLVELIDRFEKPRIAPGPWKIPPSHLAIVMVHADAADVVARHLPIWRLTASRVVLTAPVGQKLAGERFSGVEQVEIGEACHHGESSARRIGEILQWALGQSWDFLQLHEYDSLSFAIPAQAFPDRDGMSASVFPQDNAVCMGARGHGAFYLHYPHIYTRTALEKVVAALSRVPAPDREYSDRLVGMAAELAAVPVKDLRGAGLAFSQNTIYPADASKALEAQARGAVLFHGIKDAGLFDRLSAVANPAPLAGTVAVLYYGGPQYRPLLDEWVKMYRASGCSWPFGVFVTKPEDLPYPTRVVDISGSETVRPGEGFDIMGAIICEILTAELGPLLYLDTDTNVRADLAEAFAPYRNAPMAMAEDIASGKRPAIRLGDGGPVVPKMNGGVMFFGAATAAKRREIVEAYRSGFKRLLPFSPDDGTVDGTHLLEQDVWGFVHQHLPGAVRLPSTLNWPARYWDPNPSAIILHAFGAWKWRSGGKSLFIPQPIKSATVIVVFFGGPKYRPSLDAWVATYERSECPWPYLVCTNEALDLPYPTSRYDIGAYPFREGQPFDIKGAIVAEAAMRISGPVLYLDLDTEILSNPAAVLGPFADCDLAMPVDSGAAFAPQVKIGSNGGSFLKRTGGVMFFGSDARRAHLAAEYIKAWNELRASHDDGTANPAHLLEQNAWSLVCERIHGGTLPETMNWPAHIRGSSPSAIINHAFGSRKWSASARENAQPTHEFPSERRSPSVKTVRRYVIGAAGKLEPSIR